MEPIKLKHLLSIEDLSNEDILSLINRANLFKNGLKVELNNKVFVSNLFFENSTRTHRSFEMAERKLNMEVIQFDASTSSIHKGETLYDTVLTLDALGLEVIVIRHSKVAYYEELVQSKSLSCSIINGGDGEGQHPSQSLLDLMTIYNEFNHFEGLKIAIIGDIRHSRVARSNAQILKRLQSKIYLCGPEDWYSSDFDQYGEKAKFDEIIHDVDVVMLLRVQHERHESNIGFTQSDYHQAYGLTNERYTKLNDTCIIMHPAPVNRDSEIANECVESEKSRIVEQMRNGVFMRMAILEAICHERGILS